MYMGVKSLRQLDAGVERLPSVFGESLHTELEPSVDELNVGSFLEGIIHDRLVLINCHRAGGINNVPACL
jgi:hypothetical protein